MYRTLILCILHRLPCSETYLYSQSLVFHVCGYLGHYLLSSHLPSVPSFSSNLSPPWVLGVTGRQLCEKMKVQSEQKCC